SAVVTVIGLVSCHRHFMRTQSGRCDRGAVAGYAPSWLRGVPLPTGATEKNVSLMSSRVFADHVSPLEPEAPGCDVIEVQPMNRSLPDPMRSVSEAIGEAWANEVANGLRAQTRGLVGGWPGTLREARSRVLFGLRAARRPTFDAEQLTALTR